MQTTVETVIGQRFGRLVLIGEPFTGRNSKCVAMCRCDCGKESLHRFMKAAGRPQSSGCGCDRSELVRKSKTTHGCAGRANSTMEYHAWSGMIARCENANNPAYEDYGGRGISVCQRWRESFEAFLKDMGPRPSGKHTLDRFPSNDGNYEPGNTRWATRIQQNRNRRSNRLITIDGVTRCVVEWSECPGAASHVNIRARKRMGWPDREAVFGKSV